MFVARHGPHGHCRETADATDAADRVGEGEDKLEKVSSFINLPAEEKKKKKSERARAGERAGCGEGRARGRFCLVPC